MEEDNTRKLEAMQTEINQMRSSLSRIFKQPEEGLQEIERGLSALKQLQPDNLKESQINEEDNLFDESTHQYDSVYKQHQVRERREKNVISRRGRHAQIVFDNLMKGTFPNSPMTSSELKCTAKDTEHLLRKGIRDTYLLSKSSHPVAIKDIATHSGLPYAEDLCPVRGYVKCVRVTVGDVMSVTVSFAINWDALVDTSHLGGDVQMRPEDRTGQSHGNVNVMANSQSTAQHDFYIAGIETVTVYGLDEAASQLQEGPWGRSRYVTFQVITEHARDALRFYTLHCPDASSAFLSLLLWLGSYSTLYTSLADDQSTQIPTRCKSCNKHIFIDTDAHAPLPPTFRSFISFQAFHGCHALHSQ